MTWSQFIKFLIICHMSNKKDIISNAWIWFPLWVMEDATAIRQYWSFSSNLGVLPNCGRYSFSSYSFRFYAIDHWVPCSISNSVLQYRYSVFRSFEALPCISPYAPEPPSSSFHHWLSASIDRFAPSRPSVSPPWPISHAFPIISSGVARYPPSLSSALPSIYWSSRDPIRGYPFSLCFISVPRCASPSPSPSSSVSSPPFSDLKFSFLFSW